MPLDTENDNIFHLFNTATEQSRTSSTKNRRRHRTSTDSLHISKRSNIGEKVTSAPQVLLAVDHYKKQSATDEADFNVTPHRVLRSGASKKKAPKHVQLPAEENVSTPAQDNASAPEQEHDRSERLVSMESKEGRGLNMTAAAEAFHAWNIRATVDTVLDGVANALNFVVALLSYIVVGMSTTAQIPGISILLKLLVQLCSATIVLWLVWTCMVGYKDYILAQTCSSSFSRFILRSTGLCHEPNVVLVPTATIFEPSKKLIKLYEPMIEILPYSAYLAMSQLRIQDIAMEVKYSGLQGCENTTEAHIAYAGKHLQAGQAVRKTYNEVASLAKSMSINLAWVATMMEQDRGQKNVVARLLRSNIEVDRGLDQYLEITHRRLTHLIVGISHTSSLLNELHEDYLRLNEYRIRDLVLIKNERVFFRKYFRHSYSNRRKLDENYHLLTVIQPPFYNKLEQTTLKILQSLNDTASEIQMLREMLKHRAQHGFSVSAEIYVEELQGAADNLRKFGNALEKARDDDRKREKDEMASGELVLPHGQRIQDGKERVARDLITMP